MLKCLHYLSPYLLFLFAKGYGLLAPDFMSDWLFMRAQDPSRSMRLVAHSLGDVPDLVEVLVQAVDGPNKDFIFKAMGNAEQDDDTAETHGGVVYFYNEQYVKVVVPNRYNGFSNGGAIYTGEAPFWEGVNSQFSFEANIQVRCWLNRTLPEPCFRTSGPEIRARDTGGLSYLEIQHSLGVYPSLVKVRARLTTGSLTSWYCDAQGSVSGHLSIVYPSHGGGFNFGYSNNTVRIWAGSSSRDYLCVAMDGWGTEQLYAVAGIVEVVAWCELKSLYEHSVALGPSVVDPQLEMTMPQLPNLETNLFSLMVRVESGPNAGFMFEGVGSAKSNTYATINTSPCVYGGIIYAYSNSTIRLWTPLNETKTGAAVCIPDKYSNGVNAMAANDVTIFIRIRQMSVLKPAIEYGLPLPLACYTFRRVGLDQNYDSLYLLLLSDVSRTDCHKECTTENRCVTFSFIDTHCKLFDSFNSSALFSETGSEVWTMQN